MVPTSVGAGSAGGPDLSAGPYPDRRAHWTGALTLRGSTFMGEWCFAAHPTIDESLRTASVA